MKHKVSKKGVVSMPIVIVILLVLGIVLVVTSFMFSKMRTVLQQDQQFNTTSVNKIFGASTQTYKNLDTTILFIFIGFILALLITSALIKTNQIFLVIMIIFLIILVVMAMVVSNAWDATTNADSELKAHIVSDYPKTNFLLGNLPPIIFITDILALIAMFSRRGEVI